jgi:hypothetical protein
MLMSACEVAKGRNNWRVIQPKRDKFRLRVPLACRRVLDQGHHEHCNSNHDNTIRSRHPSVSYYLKLHRVDILSMEGVDE